MTACASGGGDGERRPNGVELASRETPWADGQGDFLHTCYVIFICEVIR